MIRHGVFLTRAEAMTAIGEQMRLAKNMEAQSGLHAFVSLPFKQALRIHPYSLIRLQAFSAAFSFFAAMYFFKVTSSMILFSLLR